MQYNITNVKFNITDITIEDEKGRHQFPPKYSFRYLLSYDDRHSKLGNGNS